MSDVHILAKLQVLTRQGEDAIWRTADEAIKFIEAQTAANTALARENAALREALGNIAWATPEKTAFAADKLWEIQSATARAALAQADTVGDAKISEGAET